VHQLLIGFLPLIDDLPAPQRQALQVAFGLTAGPAPEPFLVGLACLTLLSRTAADQPVLTIVDDAHWIDAESAQVLGFVARRLYADRVGMLLVVADAERNPLALVDVGSHYTAEELAARAYQPYRSRSAGSSRTVTCTGCAACRARCRSSCCWPRPMSPGTAAGVAQAATAGGIGAHGPSSPAGCPAVDRPEPARGRSGRQRALG
jgi:hypothetical protein